MNNTYWALFMFSIVIINGCKSGLTDNSNKIKEYNKKWMAENLNGDTFRNGDSIPEAKTKGEWMKAAINSTPAWCYYIYPFGMYKSMHMEEAFYDDTEDLRRKYKLRFGGGLGKLYNFYAVIDPRGLAPAGWHIPNNTEWQELINHLGGNDVAGKRMKSINGWNNVDDHEGDRHKKVDTLNFHCYQCIGRFYTLKDGYEEVVDEGFNGFPGGARMGNRGDYYYYPYGRDNFGEWVKNPCGKYSRFGFDGYWWSSSQTDDSFYVSIFNLEHHSDRVNNYVHNEKEWRLSNGYYVRCIKDY